MRAILLIGERFQERDQGFFISRAEGQATVGMLGEVWIERGTPLHAGAVVLDGFLQRLETAVVHVGCGQFHVSQRWHAELALVALPAGDALAARIGERGIQAVVREILALKQRPAVAVKTIGAELFAPRIVFGMEQLETALLLRGKFGFALNDAVELR